MDSGKRNAWNPKGISKAADNRFVQGWFKIQIASNLRSIFKCQCSVSLVSSTVTLTWRDKRCPEVP
jgi:hypothetical protein